MGASAARITAEDFVTPPELRDRRLAVDGAGRIGGVRLELRGDTGTSLGSCYQQVPLRVLPLFQRQPQQPALIYLLNPTAGLLDGDGQLVQITARQRSRAVVVGQSATRIHPCLAGFSTQQWHVAVEDDAVLVVLPGPAIPFQGCRYYQRVVIDLAPRAGLVWGDIWTAGRYARADVSEQFQFAAMVQDLSARRDGSLVYRDRFAWHGPWEGTTARWHFGSSLACGSLFVTGGDAERLRAGLPDAAGTPFLTAANDLVLRWQGRPERVTAAVVRAALAAASLLANGESTTPWLLPGHDLAPNHWFTLPDAEG
jgi:urease accessory protein